MNHVINDAGDSAAVILHQAATGTAQPDYAGVLIVPPGAMAWDFVLLVGLCSLVYSLLSAGLDSSARVSRLLLWTTPRSRVCEVPVLPAMRRPRIPAMPDIGHVPRWTPVEH